MSTYLDVVRYRELLGNLFRRDLQAKYRGSLGAECPVTGQRAWSQNL